MPTEFFYDMPLWKVRRLGSGWYQGETSLFAAPTQRTRDPDEARRWITIQVNRFLAANGYQPVDTPKPFNPYEKGALDRIPT